MNIKKINRESLIASEFEVHIKQIPDFETFVSDMEFKEKTASGVEDDVNEAKAMGMETKDVSVANKLLKLTVKHDVDNELIKHINFCKNNTVDITIKHFYKKKIVIEQELKMQLKSASMKCKYGDMFAELTSELIFKNV